MVLNFEIIPLKKVFQDFLKKIAIFLQCCDVIGVIGVWGVLNIPEKPTLGKKETSYCSTQKGKRNQN